MNYRKVIAFNLLKTYICICFFFNIIFSFLDPFSDTKTAIIISKDDLSTQDNFSSKNMNTIRSNSNAKNVFSEVFETQFNIDDDNDDSNIKNNNINKNNTFNVNNKISLQTNDLFGLDDKNNSVNNNSSKTIKNDFFDAFNDNFSKSKIDLNANNKLNAFGDDIKTETNTLDDGFDDEFSKMDITSTSPSKKNWKTGAVKNNNVENFAKFDAFNDNFYDPFTKVSNKNQSNNDVMEKKSAKTINKFSEDYSKNDDFGADLEAILQRSMLEK